MSKSKSKRKTPKVTKDDMIGFWTNFNDKLLQDILLVRWMNELIIERNEREV